MRRASTWCTASSVPEWLVCFALCMIDFSHSQYVNFACLLMLCKGNFTLLAQVLYLRKSSMSIILALILSNPFFSRMSITFALMSKLSSISWKIEHWKWHSSLKAKKEGNKWSMTICASELSKGTMRPVIQKYWWLVSALTLFISIILFKILDYYIIWSFRLYRSFLVMNSFLIKPFSILTKLCSKYWYLHAHHNTQKPRIAKTQYSRRAFTKSDWD